MIFKKMTTMTHLYCSLENGDDAYYNDNHGFLCPVSSFPTLGQSRWFCGKCSRHIFLHDDDHNFHDVQHTYHNHYNHYPQIWVHCSIGGLVLVIAFILTAGYAITCRNMWDIIAIIISLHFDHQNADGMNVFFLHVGHNHHQSALLTWSAFW